MKYKSRITHLYYKAVGEMPGQCDPPHNLLTQIIDTAKIFKKLFNL